MLNDYDYQELWRDGDGRPYETSQGGAQAEVVVDQHWGRGQVLLNNIIFINTHWTVFEKMKSELLWKCWIFRKVILL